MTGRSDYYTKIFNFIPQQNCILLWEWEGIGGLLILATREFFVGGKGMIFIWAEYKMVLFRVSVKVCSLNFIFIPLV